MRTQLLFCAALAALALVSCKREPAPTDGTPVTVTVNILGTAPTRATGVTYDNESKVGNLQVYVFKDGKLEDYRNAGASMTAQLTATAGERTIWALVNAPSIADVTTDTELASKVSQLSDNATDSFVMTGYTNQTLTDGGTVGITVKRIVSKVVIRKITSGFQYSLADEPLTIDGIYLINVAADNNYAVDGTPSKWVNQLGHKDNGYDALLYDAVGATVRKESPYTVEHAFYPYPNPIAEVSHEATWKPRHTMLVVEVTFEGKKGYYPCELPVLERNKTYIIEELIVTHRPGDVPYDPIQTGDATVQITVNDWENGLNLGTVTL